MARHRQELETVGQRLKKQREALGLSYEDVINEIRVSKKYVQALEDDAYGVFSAKVYAKGFLNKIAGILAIEDKETLLKEFDNEWEVQMFRKNPEITPLPENRGAEPVLTPRRIAGIAGAGVLVFLLVLVGFRLSYFIRAPELLIQEPGNRVVLPEPLVRIRGKTGKESRLTVNGREITIDAQGNFNEEFELTPGLNVLKITVENRFGKKNEEVRYVLVE